MLYSRILLILITFFLVTCKSSQPEVSNSERTPAQATPTSLDLSKDLVRTAAQSELNGLGTQGNPRASLLRFFVQAADRRLNKYSGDQKELAKISALYSLYLFLTEKNDWNSSYSFLLGKENFGAEKYLKTLREKNVELQLALQRENNSEVTTEMLAGASISYLRFLSNQVSKAVNSLSMQSPVPPELIQARNRFAKIPGKVAALSFATNGLISKDELNKRIASISKDPDWEGFLKFTRENYFALKDTDDINGLSAELETVTSMQIMSEMLHLLLQSNLQNSLKEILPVGYAESPEQQVEIGEDIPLLFLSPLQQYKTQRQPAQASKAPHTILVGNIPGQYIEGGKPSTYYLGYIEIQDRLISKISRIAQKDIEAFQKEALQKDKTLKFIELKNANNKNKIAKTADLDPQYDVIYPGLIDLHDHTKQNNIPVWEMAEGQFDNRFEWRDWDSYTKSVSQNMNPWKDFGKPIECATFRWSEMQAMVVGTTYLQGASTCVKNFGILRVEDKDSYISQKDAVQAPTDIVVPDDFHFLWQTLRPLMKKDNLSYEAALAQVVGQYCPNLKNAINASNVNEKAGLDILKDQKKLKDNCPDTNENPLPAKFTRYIYWHHPGVAGKIKYAKSPKKSAIIAHLAEGRRDDPYNVQEYEMINLLGLDQTHVNFVHGVGIKPENFEEMANKKMGIVWSPFSNLILYGQTLDIEKAKKAGVLLALGSDWLPTGSKGPLEEVKVAAQYVDKLNLQKTFTDDELFKMLTENPAKMLNHFDNIPGKEAGIGRIAVGSMGTVIAATLLHENPATNLVRYISERDINLVVIDGKPIYGNIAYLDNCPSNQCEKISELDGIVTAKQNIPEALKLPEKSNAEEYAKHLEAVGRQAFAWNLRAEPSDKCQFTSDKGFIIQASAEPAIDDFKEKTKLNLDLYSDLYKILALSVMTQSLNKNSSEGDVTFATKYFPSLYSCNDNYHMQRITGQVHGKDNNDDWSKNQTNRLANRTKYKLNGSVPKKLAELYK